MSTWQERIVRWRFSKSVFWRSVGFLLKAGVENTILGLPILVLVYGLTTVLGISISELVAAVPNVQYSRLFTVLILTPATWLKLRCFLTDKQPEAQSRTQ